MPRNEIAGSYGNSIFSFLRNLHTVFHSGCTNLHSTNRVGGLPFLHTFLAFVICRQFNDGHLSSVRWHLIIVLICTALIISNVENLFMCLLAINMSSLEKCLCRSSAHGVVCLLLLGCMSCLPALEFKPLLVTSFANTFSIL